MISRAETVPLCRNAKGVPSENLPRSAPGVKLPYLRFQGRLPPARYLLRPRRLVGERRRGKYDILCLKEQNGDSDLRLNFLHKPPNALSMGWVSLTPTPPTLVRYDQRGFCRCNVAPGKGFEVITGSGSPRLLGRPSPANPWRSLSSNTYLNRFATYSGRESRLRMNFRMASARWFGSLGFGINVMP